MLPDHCESAFGGGGGRGERQALIRGEETPAPASVCAVGGAGRLASSGPVKATTEPPQMDSRQPAVLLLACAGSRVVPGGQNAPATLPR